MILTVENEAAATSEAVAVLMERLPASRVARLLSSWQMGLAHYLKLRAKLCADETPENRIPR